MTDARTTARRIIHDSLCPCATDITVLFCKAPPGRIDDAIAKLISAGLIVVLANPVGSYRVGNHNPRNIYRSGVDRDTDEQVAVAFAPEMGRLIVVALNALAGGPDA